MLRSVLRNYNRSRTRLFEHQTLDLTQWRPSSAKASALTANSQQVKASEEDLKAARTWLENLHQDTLPKNIGEFTFSRSSGPGGQNVNK